MKEWLSLVWYNFSTMMAVIISIALVILAIGIIAGIIMAIKELFEDKQIVEMERLERLYKERLDFEEELEVARRARIMNEWNY